MWVLSYIAKVATSGNEEMGEIIAKAFEVRHQTSELLPCLGAGLLTIGGRHDDRWSCWVVCSWWATAARRWWTTARPSTTRSSSPRYVTQRPGTVVGRAAGTCDVMMG